MREFDELEALMAKPASPLAEIRRAGCETGWRGWLASCAQHFTYNGFAPHHEEFWDWVWTIENGERPQPAAHINIWSRSHAKSTSAELAIAMLCARLKRKYVVYVCRTQDQADTHVANIGGILESQAVADVYPTVGQRLVNEFGHAKGWKRSQLRSAAGFSVEAYGLDSAQRGAKIDQYRPDLICHEIGTQILDGEWLGPVEEHPRALGLRRADGLEINLWGLPESEVVTKEHRYWTRRGWVEAQNLTTKDEIAYPIDSSIAAPPPITTYAGGRITKRNDDGTVADVEAVWEDRERLELRNPDWWWMIGYLWGDGHVAGDYQVGASVALTQPEIRERITAVLNAYQISYSIIQKVGCEQVIWSQAWLNRWLRTWKYGPSGRGANAGMKCPPAWVERIDLDMQRELILGYIAADGYVTPTEVKITSVSRQGLDSLTRMLARLGVASSVRFMKAAGRAVICGIECNTKDKYDLRIGHGAALLGLDIQATSRYKKHRVEVEDGCLWRRVRSVADAPDRVFAPIQTESRRYLTAFGVSHNCFDDVDDPKDTEETVLKNIDVLTKGLLPTGSRWLAIMGVQNLIMDYGIFGRMVSGEADYLIDRHLSGPIPAIEDLETDIRENDEGQNRHVVLGGRPTWSGYTLDNAQDDIDTYGFSAFEVEFQHNTGGIGDMFPMDCWVELDTMPACRRYVRAWDFAGTDKKRSDWTVGVKMGRLNGRTYIVDVIRRRVLSGDLRELVLATARKDGKRCRIVIPKDPGQAGNYQAIDFGTGLNGYSVYAEPQTGSKTTKAEAFSGAQQLGMVHVPKAAPWLGTWKYEYNQFGGGSRWDDQVDAGASAFNRLATLGEGNTGFSGRNRNQ